MGARLRAQAVSCVTKESIKQITFLLGPDHEVFSVVPRLPTGSLLAQLRVGDGASSLFPTPLRSGGPGAPPLTAAEVSTGPPPVTLEKTS